MEKKVIKYPIQLITPYNSVQIVSNDIEDRMFIFDEQAARALYEKLHEMFGGEAYNRLDMCRAYNAGKGALIDQKNGGEFVSSERFIENYER